MTYYKAFHKDLTCIGYQFEIGKTFQVEGDLEMCRHGFHCCQILLSCLGYYPVNSRFCEVSIGDEYITDGDKTVAKQITIDREIIGDELNEMLTGVVERTFFIDDFSVITCECWYKTGLLHREGDLPAITYNNGGKEWYKFGKRHRDGNEPAIIYCNGRLEWYKNGKKL